MAKAKVEIRSLARSHTKTAVNTLVGIMAQPKAPPAAGVAAANAILDRGWGGAARPLAGEDGEGGFFRVRFTATNGQILVMSQSQPTGGAATQFKPGNTLGGRKADSRDKLSAEFIVRGAGCFVPGEFK